MHVLGALWFFFSRRWHVLGVEVSLSPGFVLDLIWQEEAQGERSKKSLLSLPTFVSPAVL
jgi:hypothetical protein